MLQSQPDAKAISQEVLDITGAALLSGDFDAFAACFSLPHEIETFEGTMTIKTMAELHERFDKVRGYFKANAVTDIVRHVMEADFVDAETIQHSHQTRVLSGPILVQAPYPSLSIMSQIDGRWRVTSSQYAIADAPDLNTALCGESNSLPTGDHRYD